MKRIKLIFPDNKEIETYVYDIPRKGEFIYKSNLDTYEVYSVVHKMIEQPGELAKLHIYVNLKKHI